MITSQYIEVQYFRV